MAEDFYPFVDSGDPAPDNSHITGAAEDPRDASGAVEGAELASYATRISIYDDMYSTPRVVVIEPGPVRAYLEEVTNTVYRCMKEQGGSLSLMVIREIVENFIHAHFVEPIISILDGGNTIRFADQGPGIKDKERAFEFGVTSANRGMKRYIRGTGAGFPMVQQYLEAAGGAVSIEDNLGAGTVVTVTLDKKRVEEIQRGGSRGAAVRSATFDTSQPQQPGWGQSAAAGFGGAPLRATAEGGVGAPQLPGELHPYPPYSGYTAPAPTMPGSTPYGGQAWTQAGYPAYQYPPAAVPAGQPRMDPRYANASAAGTGVWHQNGAAGYGAPYGAAPYGMPPTGASRGIWNPQPPGAGAQQAAHRNGEPGIDGFPPSDHEFSTYPQAAGQSGYIPGGAMGRPEGGGAGAAGPIISERGALALSFLVEHGHAGPTELADAFGQSGPTWSRELATLGKRGFIVKQGQKYYLTDLGAGWIQSHQQG